MCVLKCPSSLIQENDKVARNPSMTYLACQFKMERSHQTDVPFITTPSLLTLMLYFFPLDMQRICPTLMSLINIAPQHQSSQCLSFTLFLLHTEKILKEKRSVHLRLYGMAMLHSHNVPAIDFFAYWSMLHSHNVPVFIFLPIGQGPAPDSACLGCDYIRLLGQLDFNREI